MIWLIAAIFTIPVVLNRKDLNKFLTAISFLIVYILNAGNTFEGENLIYCNMLLSSSLLVAPSLSSGRDWSVILFIIVCSFIGSDFLAIYNFHNMQSAAIAANIDTFKNLATTMALVILTWMRNGKLDGYIISDTRIRVQRHIRGLFNLPNKRARVQGG
jgi:hypothetical protein